MAGRNWEALVLLRNAESKLICRNFKSEKQSLIMYYPITHVPFREFESALLYTHRKDPGTWQTVVELIDTVYTIYLL